MSLNTPNSPRGLSPDQTFWRAEELIPEALLYQITTIGGEIRGDEPKLRVPFVHDVPNVGFVAEGAVISETDPSLDEVTVKTGKVAKIGRVSNELRGNQAPTAGLISTGLIRAVQEKSDVALLNNPSAGPGPAGLLNISGIVDGGSVTDNLDAVVDAITTVEGNGGTASHIVMHPTAWGLVSKLKASSGSNTPLIGAPSNALERQLFGVPVIVTRWAPTDTAIVVDKANVISAAGTIQLKVDESAYFTSDSVGYRVTWRFGATMVRPERTVKLTVEAPESP